jgi:hypothetical protein
MTFKRRIICEDEPSEEEQKRIDRIIKESIESIRNKWTPHVRYQRSLGKDCCSDTKRCICKNPIPIINV